MRQLTISVESIREIRRRRIAEIWRDVSNIITPILKNNSPDFRFLGLFWSNMVKTRGGLLPNSPSTICESPNEFLSSLRSVSEEIAGQRPIYSSDSVNPGRLKSVLDQPARFGMPQFPSSRQDPCRILLSPEDMAFMEKQRSKTGCEK